MQYRELGRTGEKVGIIGLGCEYLDAQPYETVNATINEALHHGVNLFDVFMPGEEVRAQIAKALGNRRKDILIQGHIGSTDIGKQYDISRDLPTVKKYFETLLRLFGYIDFGMLFFIDSEDDYKSVFETDFVTYAQSLKQNGDIRHIGFSSHNPVTAMRAIETGVPDMLMFSINPAFDMMPVDLYALDALDKNFSDVLFKDPERARGFSGVICDECREAFRGIDPERAALYTLCEQKNVGITAMKALGAGKLLSPDHTPYAKPLSLHQCVQYALDRSAVASVLPGCQSITEMRQIMNYFTATDEEKNYAEIIIPIPS